MRAGPRYLCCDDDDDDNNDGLPIVILPLLVADADLDLESLHASSSSS